MLIKIIFFYLIQILMYRYLFMFTKNSRRFSREYTPESLNTRFWWMLARLRHSGLGNIPPKRSITPHLKGPRQNLSQKPRTWASGLTPHGPGGPTYKRWRRSCSRWAVGFSAPSRIGASHIRGSCSAPTSDITQIVSKLHSIFLHPYRPSSNIVLYARTEDDYKDHTHPNNLFAESINLISPIIHSQKYSLH